MGRNRDLETNRKIYLMKSRSTFFALTILIGALALATLACESPFEEPLPTLAPTLTRRPVTATPSKIPATPTKVLTPTATLDPTKYFGINMIINGDADCLIAGTALARNLTLVTNNTRHFSRIAGLRLDNWKLPAS